MAKTYNRIGALQTKRTDLRFNKTTKSYSFTSFAFALKFTRSSSMKFFT